MPHYVILMLLSLMCFLACVRCHGCFLFAFFFFPFVDFAIVGFVCFVACGYFHVCFWRQCLILSCFSIVDSISRHLPLCWCSDRSLHVLSSFCLVIVCGPFSCDFPMSVCEKLFSLWVANKMISKRLSSTSEVSTTVTSKTQNQKKKHGDPATPPCKREDPGGRQQQTPPSKQEEENLNKQIQAAHRKLKEIAQNHLKTLSNM